MRGAEDTAGMMPKTGKFSAEVSNVTIMIQDKMKEMAGYGAPQEAELVRLSEMLHNPSDIDPWFWVKSGGDERAYVNNQLKMLERYLKNSEATARAELGMPPAEKWGLDLDKDDGSLWSSKGQSAAKIEAMIPRD
jgi:hypothetical protein